MATVQFLISTTAVHSVEMEKVRNSIGVECWPIISSASARQSGFPVGDNFSSRHYVPASSASVAEVYLFSISSRVMVAIIPLRSLQRRFWRIVDRVALDNRGGCLEMMPD